MNYFYQQTNQQVDPEPVILEKWHPLNSLILSSNFLKIPCFFSRIDSKSFLEFIRNLVKFFLEAKLLFEGFFDFE